VFNELSTDTLIADTSVMNLKIFIGINFYCTQWTA